MPEITLEILTATIDQRFSGVIKQGGHEENGECCALELLSVVMEIPWTADPDKTRTFDLRNLNDIPVSNEVRTKHLLPVIAAYAGSLDWPQERQKAVATRIAIGTVRQLISRLAGLTPYIAEKCRQATTLEAAESAAGLAAEAAAGLAAEAAAGLAAEAAAEAAAESAAESAAEAAAGSAAWSTAWSAAWSAAEAAREAMFILACQVWMDAIAPSPTGVPL